MGLDSDYSTHMTDNKDLLTNMKPVRGPTVIFGDNAKQKIVGRGSFIRNGLTCFPRHQFEAQHTEHQPTRRKWIQGIIR